MRVCVCGRRDKLMWRKIQTKPSRLFMFSNPNGFGRKQFRPAGATKIHYTSHLLHNKVNSTGTASANGKGATELASAVMLLPGAEG